MAGPKSACYWEFKAIKDRTKGKRTSGTASRGRKKKVTEGWNKAPKISYTKSGHVRKTRSK